MVIASEIAVDVVKHAFITKFNDITADVSTKYSPNGIIADVVLLLLLYHVFEVCNNIKWHLSVAQDWHLITMMCLCVCCTIGLSEAHLTGTS